MAFKLFKKIWNKHYQSGDTSLLKLVDDIGGFRGTLSIKKVDKNMNIISERIVQNELTNLSKTNIIRLLSQGQSPWIGAIDTNQLKISKIRFGDAISSLVPVVSLPAEKTIHYYDINEASSRPSSRDYSTIGNKATSKTPNLPVILRTSSVDGGIGTNITKTTRVYTLGVGTTTPSRPPSHGTFAVDVYGPGIQGHKERLIFNQSQYIRSTTGNLVTTKYISTALTAIASPPEYAGKFGVTFPFATNATPVVNANTEPDLAGLTGTYYKIISVTGTKTTLFFDFSKDINGNWNGWKVNLDEWDSEQISNIKPKFEIGKYNIINSVVPRTGVNADAGTTAIARYGSSTVDYYAIGGGINYKLDSEAIFIDDYSVDFSIFMGRTDGNGANIIATPVKYTEVFLCCENDDIFSMISLPLNEQFEKSDEDGFYITWTIRAPLS